MLFAHNPQIQSNTVFGFAARNWKALLAGAVFALALSAYLTGNYARSGEAKAVAAPVESFDVGMKMGKYNIQLGRDTKNVYRGSAVARQQLASAQAQPLSMSAEDFDLDGMTDLVIGYATGGGGALAVRHGNLNAIAAQSDAVMDDYRAGRYPAPFLPEIDTIDLPERADFIATGDFNSDGYADIAAAARGGENVYLFAGNGKGSFGEGQRIELGGQVTAVAKGQFNERNGATSLAIGIVTAKGARVLVYDENGKGLLGQPDVFSLPAEANTLTIAKLDDDTAGDLAVGAGNTLVVIHGRNPAQEGANNNTIEQSDLPFAIRGIAAGDFIFDRESKTKLALLSDDGTVHFMTPGLLDTRPFTAAELDLRHRERVRYRRGEIDQAATIALDKSLVRASASGKSWMEADSRAGAVPTGVAPQSWMATTRVSSLPTDDLIMLDPSQNKLQVLQNTKDGKRMRALNADKMAATDSVELQSAPVAVVTARLSVDGRPSTVVLEKNNPDPFVILSVAATFNVTSNVDAPDNNPGNGVCASTAGGSPCTLRAAMMECSYFGGSNTVNLAAGTTYTLTLGPPDDEFDAFGDNQPGGDLDIIDLNRVCSQLGGGNPAAGCPGLTLGGSALTSVTIAGGNINTTVIAMGVLNSSAGGVNKDRIFDINNFADPQFDINVTMSNLTLQAGNAPHFAVGGGNFYHTPGGAIQYDGINNVNGNPLGTLTLTTVKVTANTADGQGGGVFGLDDTLVVQTNSVVTLNSSTLGAGGGISYGGGNKVTSQHFDVTSSTIGGAAAGNTAPDAVAGNGAGFASLGGAASTISSSTISNNVAGDLGGGIAYANTAGIAISNTTISNNTAKSNGGGIYSSARQAVTQAASTNTMTTVTITGNTADSDANGTGNGGGIFNLFGSMTVQTNSHVDGNAAFNGGGIFSTWTGNTNDASASLTVNGGTIGQTGSGNSAKSNGGGVMISPGAATTFGTCSITSTTIQANVANSDSSGGGDGGGIYVDSGSLNPLNTATIDTNVANGGTGDGIFMNGGSITAAATLILSGDDSLNINAGTFTSTPGIFSLAGNFTRASGGTFTHNSGTLNFNGSGAQSINGTATSETFNNFTVNKGGSSLIGGGSTTALTVAGTTTLTAGTFAPTTITGITMSGGDWTNNGGVFTPGTSVVSFTNTGAAQNINGTTASQTFNGITVAKTAQTLAVAGSTTSLTLNGSLLLTSGTFSAGTATGINVGGDWTNNGGTFTPGTGTVTFNGGGAQNLNGTAVTQTFNNFTVSKGGGTLTGGGSMTTLTVNGNFGITAGAFATGATMTTLNVAGNWANGGTFTPGASNTVVFNGNNSTQTLTGTTSFTNLTSNHTGTGGVTASGSSLTVTGLMRVQAGTFTSSSTFNNVQIDSGATLASDGNTMNVSGNWTNNGGTFTPSTGTVNFNGGGAQAVNGTAASQTFNNFTVNKAAGTLSTGGSTVALTTNDLTLTLGGFTAPATLNVNGNVLLTAGTFTAGTTINAAGNWTNNGATFTPGAGTVVLNGNNNTQTLGGTNTFGNLTSNHTGTGGVTASGSTFAVTGLFRIQAGTFTSSSTFNNVQIDSGATLASDGNTMNVTGNWTNNGGTFTPSTGTVNFNGGGAQAINGTAASQTFNNFTVNKGAGTLSTSGSTTSITTNNLTLTAGTFTSPATLDVNGNVLLTAGTLTAGLTTTVAGSWTNNGATFTAGGGTVTFDGGAGQTIAGTAATTFFNLTNADAGGIAMNNNNTVGGTLALGANNITVANTMTLSQTGATASTGTGDVIGAVKRTNTAALATVYTFGNPNNQITTTVGTAPSDITVNLVKSVPAGFPTAVQRTYTITPTGGSGITATLRLHYLDAELNGNSEATLVLRRFNGSGWQPFAATASDNSANWVENNVVHNFSAWTISSCCLPTAGNSSVTGRITDGSGAPVAGAVINLSGNQTRKTITDANGNYQFDNVDANGFYTVTPARANFSFSPAQRSFSQVGNKTEAAFTGTRGGDTANPLDTPEYFVRQQYVDVLGREPEEGGFNFWSDQLLACGNDASCMNVRRRDVAASFFISEEYQASGSYIYDVYAGALGRQPVFSEYSADRQQVVGGATLDAAKTAFARDFVQRAAFVTKYQGAMTAEAFVDALLQSVQSSGANLGDQRDSLIGLYNQGTDLVTNRAAVVKALADNATFKQSQYNRSFVLTEYFAYLRRDIDQGGYEFWLNVLNNREPGNYRGMVCSFVTSAEYQNRFSAIVSHGNGECGQ
jgi:hypothetical protein